MPATQGSFVISKRKQPCTWLPFDERKSGQHPIDMNTLCVSPTSDKIRHHKSSQNGSDPTLTARPHSSLPVPLTIVRRPTQGDLAVKTPLPNGASQKVGLNPSPLPPSYPETILYLLCCSQARLIFLHPSKVTDNDLKKQLAQRRFCSKRDGSICRCHRGPFGK